MVVEGENLMSWVMLPHMLAAKPWVSHVTFLRLSFSHQKNKKKQTSKQGGRAEEEEKLQSVLSKSIRRSHI